MKLKKLMKKLFSLINWVRRGRQGQFVSPNPIFVNPFDTVAEAQNKDRMEADGYCFFVENGFITTIEAINLYKWFDKDGEVRDKDGKMRVRLLRKLPGHAVKGVVNLEKLYIQPSRLVNEIKKRTSGSEVNL
jgi:hypothetical protein